jgi:diguanylate cyclase (GGDEF)-like protein
MQPVSTRTKLVSSIGVILFLGFMAVNFANYHVSRKSVRQALIHNELPLTSNNIYSEIQASLLRPIYISSLMANDTFLKDWLLDGEINVDRVTKYLREIRDRYNVFSTFVVSNITKRYYHFAGVLKTVSPNVPKDSWFFTMESYPQNYRVDVDFNEAAGFALTIFINHKIFDYGGRFIGVTGLGLNAIAVSDLIQKYMRTYHRNIYLVGRDGLIKGHKDNRVVEKVNIRNKPGISQVADELLSRESGFLEYRSSGDNILLTYRFIPELDWYLVVEQPEGAAMKEIRQTFYVNTGISLSIIVVVLLISGYTVNLFQQRLESMAKVDKLTGVYNRQFFEALCENAIKRVRRNGSPLSLMAFDVDSFKVINDRYGHLLGDRILHEVAQSAKRAVRSSDVIARWGGDEFLVLMHGCDGAQASQVAEKCRQRMTAEIHLPERDSLVTISAGVAQYHEGDSYEALLARADDGLYQAKHQGRNQVVRVASDADSSETLRARQPKTGAPVGDG